MAIKKRKDEELELLKEREEEERLKKFEAMRDMALNQAPKFSFAIASEDEEGVLAVALVFSASGKAFLFHPSTYDLKIGDVVTVLDMTGVTRYGTVIMENSRVKPELITCELQPVQSIAYKNPLNINSDILKSISSILGK